MCRRRWRGERCGEQFSALLFDPNQPYVSVPLGGKRPTVTTGDRLAVLLTTTQPYPFFKASNYVWATSQQTSVYSGGGSMVLNTLSACGKQTSPTPCRVCRSLFPNRARPRSRPSFSSAPAFVGATASRRGRHSISIRAGPAGGRVRPGRGRRERRPPAGADQGAGDAALAAAGGAVRVLRPQVQRRVLAAAPQHQDGDRGVPLGRLLDEDAGPARLGPAGRPGLRLELPGAPRLLGPQGAGAGPGRPGAGGQVRPGPVLPRGDRGRPLGGQAVGPAHGGAPRRGDPLLQHESLRRRRGQVPGYRRGSWTTWWTPRGA